MNDFIVIRGVDGDTGAFVESRIGEFSTANEAVSAFARFLTAVGYAPESVHEALQEVAYDTRTQPRTDR